MIPTLALSALIPSIGPGPMDACKLNYSQIKAGMNFQYDLAVTNYLPKININDQGWGLASTPELTVFGKWDTDGSVEHILIKKEDIKKLETSAAGIVPYEVIYSNKICALRLLERGRNKYIVVSPADKPPVYLCGPFAWWMSPFPAVIDTEFKDARITVRMGSREGRQVIVETREKDINEGILYRISILYDPLRGHLPVFIRCYTFNLRNTRNSSNLKDFYLLKARRCAAGGFVPEKWLEAWYRVDDFNPNSPKYQEDERLTPASRVVLGFFQAREIVDRSDPASLTQLDGVAQIAAPGGLTRLPAGARTLSLPDILRAVGEKMNVKAGTTAGHKRKERI